MAIQSGFPFRKLATSMTSAALACCACFSAQAQEQDWWFDVEIIIFERTLPAEGVSETFAPSQRASASNSYRDLFTPYLTASNDYLLAGLAYCEPKRQAEAAKQAELIWPEPPTEPEATTDTEPFATDSPTPEVPGVFDSLTAQHPSVEGNPSNSDTRVDSSFGSSDTSNDITSRSAIIVSSTADALPSDSTLTTSAQQGSAATALSQVSIEANTASLSAVNSTVNPSIQSASSVQPRQSTPDFEYQVVSEDVFSSPNPQRADTSREHADVEAVPTRSEVQANAPADINETVNEAIDTASTEQAPAPTEPLTVDWIDWHIPKSLPCAYAAQTEPDLAYLAPESDVHPLADISSMPVKIDGVEWQNKRETFILPSRLYRLHKLYKEIDKAADIEPILHSSWRQKVEFGQSKATQYRLFAGDNFQVAESKPEAPALPYMPAEERALLSDQAYQDWLQSQGVPTEQASNSDALFDYLEQVLANNDAALTPSFELPIMLNTDTTELDEVETSTPLWQLDGYIKVYLKYVNRVPYLHIQSELDYRWPEQQATEPTLKVAQFSQLRRIISKQVHYFDHPLFGMIIRLDRHRWPAPAQQ